MTNWPPSLDKQMMLAWPAPSLGRVKMNHLKFWILSYSIRNTKLEPNLEGLNVHKNKS